MNVSLLATSSEYGDTELYPTPPSVARKLLEGLKWEKIEQVLEPSAGTGNLVNAVIDSKLAKYGRYHNNSPLIFVDCVEIDPHIRSVLKYEFCGERRSELGARLSELKKIQQTWIPETRRYLGLDSKQEFEHDQLEKACFRLDKAKVFVVGDDFLKFDTLKEYDLIVMNPPFSCGDKHLLKAISFVREYGGEIRCILNAETLRNPYSETRKFLVSTLQNYGAEIEYLENAFNGLESERSTDVEIAIVKVSIPKPERKSKIFDNLMRAESVEDDWASDVTDLSVSDFFAQIITRYNVEVKAGIDLIREYRAMSPYLSEEFLPDGGISYPTLILEVQEHNTRYTYSSGNLSINKYIQLVRRKYWKALFSNKEFIGKLTSKLRNEYSNMVEKLVDYDFTMFNIQVIFEQMQSDMGKGIQETIVALFDTMTEKHSWYPECEKNTHYFNGWATNKAHKINTKVILPVNGAYSEYGWSTGKLNVRFAEDTILDIEKVFDYLDNGETEPPEGCLRDVLERAQQTGNAKNIPCKYFNVTFYKKGTMHIKFHRQDLVDKFNIYCCLHKNWLPPCYGKTKYADLSKKEQTVVDGFHGDGSEGSGEKKYSEVLNRQSYFLGEPKKTLLALGS